MKTGIIIIFHNYAEEIDTDFFRDYVNKGQDLEICLVNNNSDDNTYELLKEISEKCNNFSVLNINKFRTDISAIRAGVRYLVNQFNLREIGYINTDVLMSNQNELNKVLKILIDEQDAILIHKNQVSQQKKIKQTIFQSVFSLLECIECFNNQRCILNYQD